MKVYGPYTRKDGRKHVILIDGEKRRTVSYPKYLMEQKLGRELLDTETVDHRDSNKFNDDIDNLQILTRAENAEKDVVKVEDIIVNCAWCNVVMTMSLDQRQRALDKCAGPFCGRSCTGKYGKAIQMGTIQKLPRTEFEIKYYKDSGSPLSEAQKKQMR